mmetsp:Transcript_31688/g.48518  ORF Transcript_31688/g.48518 Transcript_31688/m.48518 type:complete len:127 (-) Transcript_31688:50-430(-)|eukprot:CAMPEP_0170479448 /NCGR_PEP_ID=MMETSP0208-20121228/685_1 /TAXON_ID=197538 /ORGANISM="Strombidium inclinatum, Strain S3" /LENGTH=126 /DNA_ID=CAMNT_0010751845 /DNA_START=881 /DNA_END=1261 /DNA_ORIENTATION=+
MEVLGSANDNDKSFLVSPSSVDFLSEHSTDIGKANFCLELDNSSPELTRIMHYFLEINPYFRMSAETVLALPIFSEVRKEKSLQFATEKIELQFDAEGAVSYEGKITSQVHNLKDYEKMLWDVVKP